MKTLIIRKIHIEERRPFRQQAAFAVPCGADSLRLLRETRFVFHGIIPLFCFSLVPAKLLLLRHASARAASRCVMTRALLIVAGWSFSPYAKWPAYSMFCKEVSAKTWDIQAEISAPKTIWNKGWLVAVNGMNNNQLNTIKRWFL